MIPLRAHFGRIVVTVDFAEQDSSGLLRARGSRVRARSVETCTRLAADEFLEMRAPIQVSGHGYRQHLRALYGWPGAVVEVGPVHRGCNLVDGLYVIPEDPRRGYETPLEAAQAAALRFVSALRSLPRT